MDNEERLDEAINPYIHAVGHIRYLADCTRPDISHVTGILGRYTKCPTMRHWQALRRVLDYLRSTPTTE